MADCDYRRRLYAITLLSVSATTATGKHLVCSTWLPVAHTQYNIRQDPGVSCCMLYGIDSLVTSFGVQCLTSLRGLHEGKWIIYCCARSLALCYALVLCRVLVSKAVCLSCAVCLSRVVGCRALVMWCALACLLWFAWRAPRSISFFYCQSALRLSWPGRNKVKQLSRPNKAFWGKLI